ncbi:caspase family protein [Thermodesulfobacteriota bacterium]
MHSSTLMTAALSLSLILFATGGAWAKDRAVDKQVEATVRVDPQKTYVLAIGCCVPWKGPHTCRGTVRLFSDAASSRLGIPHENIKTVIDQKATYAGVVKGFKWLSAKIGPEDTVIVYYYGHGILLSEGSGAGDPEYAFVLWSEKFPFAGLYAVLAHIWMNDRQFSTLVNKLPARAKLVIADTCHALRAGADLYPKGNKIDYGLDDAALMAAAEAGQPALSLPNYGLFTEQLVAAMNSGVDNLKEAFDLAQPKTMKESRTLCSDIRIKRPKVDCLEQGPTLEDPNNIIPLFRLRNHAGKATQNRSSHR